MTSGVLFIKEGNEYKFPHTVVKNGKVDGGMMNMSFSINRNSANQTTRHCTRVLQAGALCNLEYHKTEGNEVLLSDYAYLAGV
jgi:hypothetical protein